MILDGLIIMIIGLTVVFTFLVLIILAMRAMSAIILKFFPEKEAIVAVSRRSDDAEIAAAIAAVKALTQS